MGADCDILFSLTGDARRNSRALRQLRALSRAGYKVQAVTLGPDEEESPLLPGIRLHSLREPKERGPRFFLQIHRDLLRLASGISARIYHASDLFCLPAMASAAAARAIPYSYDSRELYSGLASAHGRPWVRRFWYLIERRYIRQARLVITVNESIADRLARIHEIPRPVVLPNVPRATRTRPAHRLRRLLSLPDGLPILLYQGFIKSGRGCEHLVEIARRVPECAAVFIGEGALRNRLEVEVQTSELAHRVKFLNLIPPDELLPLTADADIGVCLIEGFAESLRLALPNKLFEYLAAGLPVLGSDLPEIRRIVATYDVGLVAREGDPEQLASIARQMIGDAQGRKRWSANTHRVFDGDYNPTTIEERFLGAIADALNG